MKEPEFLVVPGPVTSQTDGDRHYVNAWRLMDLFGVRADECVILKSAFMYKKYEGLYFLTPQYDGDYSLPDVTEDPCLPYQPSSSICEAATIDALAFLTKLIPV